MPLEIPSCPTYQVMACWTTSLHRNIVFLKEGSESKLNVAMLLKSTPLRKAKFPKGGLYSCRKTWGIVPVTSALLGVSRDFNCTELVNPVLAQASLPHRGTYQTLHIPIMCRG